MPAVVDIIPAPCGLRALITGVDKAKVDRTRRLSSNVTLNSTLIAYTG